MKTLCDLLLIWKQEFNYNLPDFRYIFTAIEANIGNNYNDKIKRQDVRFYNIYVYDKKIK